MSLNTEKLIVLRKIKYQESDLIIHGINSQGMKVAYLAKGALKSKKRFSGGVLDPFHYIEVGLTKSASSSHALRAIQEARLLRSFDAIKADYDRLQLGFYFLELVYKVTQVGEGYDDTLFQLLGHVLMALEIAEDLQLLKTHFAIKFLLQQGVLQSEPWMRIFTQMPMAKNKELAVQKDQILSYHQADKIEQTVKNYLIHAQVDSF